MATKVPISHYVEGLMLWIHERPQMYALHAGELDAVLWTLHSVWAKMVNREAEYKSVLYSVDRSSRRRLKDDERICRVDLNDKATKNVLRFWAKINKKLDVQVRVDSWTDSKGTGLTDYVTHK